MCSSRCCFWGGVSGVSLLVGETMNREWRQGHKMPPKATEKERLAWHLEHTQHCACTPFPPGLVAKLSAPERRKVEKRKVENAVAAHEKG